jgi:hypothetical protein
MKLHYRETTTVCTQPLKASKAHSTVSYRISRVSAALILFACVSQCQQTPPDKPVPADSTNKNDNNSLPEQQSKHVFGLIPNFRTSPSLKNYEPVKPGEKFKLAAQDSFDRGTIALAAIIGGEGQLSNDNRSFGQGVQGYAQYFGAAYGDFVIGNYMTEAIFPCLLHQDPRYFRRGTGSGWSRMGYAAGQIFWTHRDSGSMQFNFSEVIGNSTAVAISNAYYVDNRTAHQAVSKLGLQLGVDMATNILKEFWPDVERKFKRKHDGAAATKP